MEDFLQRNKHFYQLAKSKIDFHASGTASIDKNLLLIRKLGEFAWRNHPGCFYDSDIENLLSFYSNHLEDLVEIGNIPQDISTWFPLPTEYSTLHVATEVAGIGGHTRLIRQIMRRSGERHQCLVLTNTSLSVIPEWFGAGMETYVQACSLKNFRTPFERAYALRLLAQRFQRVIIYAHPHDVIPSLAFAVPGDVPVALENHAHSWFWHGRSIADLIVCHTRYHTDFTMRYRSADNCLFLPFTLSDHMDRRVDADEKAKAKALLHIDPRKTVILTVGTREKYIPNKEYNYFHLLKVILDMYPDVVCIVVGLPKNDPMVRGFDLPERVIFHAQIPDLTNYYLASDICLEAMPQPSLGVQSHAPVIGLSCPVPKYGKSRVFRNHTLLQSDAYRRHFGEDMTREEFFEKLDGFIRNPELRMDVAREIRTDYLRHRADNALHAGLVEMYRILDSCDHRPEELREMVFFDDEENREIAERSELQSLDKVKQFWKNEITDSDLSSSAAAGRPAVNLSRKYPGGKGARADSNPTSDNREPAGHSRDVRAIAFYLPQFHPIPENDIWWGKGFTEWTNVSKAKPLFPGHYQPHVPSDLGYYDLRLAETRKAQAVLAREHGIHGFCYYHYWFNGKLLLDYPLRQVLESGEPDFPFCLCWANENWTRAWDGRDCDVLIQQNYSAQDDLDHIRHLCGIFRDPRYIQVDGKPLFIVYRASNLPDPLATTTLWREEARRQGIGGLFLCRVERFVQDMTDPRALGFDAAIEFQPDGIHLGKPREDLMHTGHHVYDYHALIRAALSKSEPDYLRFPCVCPSWDNSPRRRKGAVIFHNTTPQLYELWLKEVLARLLQSQTKERIVFINAFNEWGEGCHLEPDHRFGRTYLEATRRAVLFANDRGQVRPAHSSPGAGAESEMPGEMQPSPVTGKSTSTASRVSIVIPVFNKVEFTRKCIYALFSNTPPGAFECIVVNNGSTDGTRDYLEGLGNRVRVIANPENLGFARACNQGAQAASSPYVLFLNNDTEPRPGWLAALVAVLDSDPTAAAAGSRMLFPDGTIQHAGVLIIDDKKLPDPLVGRHLYYGLPADHREANVSRTYQALTAGCLLVRRNLFEEVGMFDEGYWNGYEDLDLCFRLQEKGWILVYQPESVLIHHESKSGPERFTKIKENIQRLHEKWIGRITPDAVIEEDGTLLWTDARRIRLYEAPGRQGEHESLRQPEAMQGPVSIVILSFNGLEYTKQCVQSIQEHTPEPHEIIFVDNGSTDDTVQWLRTLAEKNSNYKLIENEENLGFARGCNQGIQMAEGAYILLLNNDVIVTQGWLSGMLRHLDSSGDIGMVGPMSNSVSGPQLVDGAPDESDLKRMHAFALELARDNAGRFEDTLRLVGFCLLIKRSLIEIIGGLDEKYGSGNFEDDDLCLRSRIAGFRNIMARDVFIHHYGSMTFTGNSIDYEQVMGKNRTYFAEKWKNILEMTEDGYRLHLTMNQRIGILIEMGEQRYAEDDLAGAVRVFRRVLEIDPTNSQALNNLGVIQWELGSIDDAIVTMHKALSLNPRDPDALANLLDALVATNRHNLVQADLIELVKRAQPENPDIGRLCALKEQAGSATRDFTGEAS